MFDIFNFFSSYNSSLSIYINKTPYKIKKLYIEYYTMGVITTILNLLINNFS